MPADTRQRRPVVALFVDIVGFTPMVEAEDPEEVHDRLTEAFTALRGAVERHGGIVEKYIGDAVLALFGTRQAHRDDVDRAVAAALDATTALASLQGRISVRCGIEAGEVLVDTERVDSARDLMVVGDAVNTAARLQQSARPGRIVLGPEAAALTSAPMGPAVSLELKGKSEPVTVRTVEGPPTGASPDGPMFGREAEMDRLAAVLDRVVTERRSRFVGIVGEPGMGKSRLVEAFLASLPAPAVVRRASCRPFGEGSTADTLRQILAPDIDSGLALSEALSVTAGLSEVSFDPGSPMWSGRFAEAKVAWREHLASIGDPLILVLDDAHWLGGDAASILLEAAAARPATLTVLVSWQEGPLRDWVDDNLTLITLDGLDEATLRDLGRHLGIAAEDLDHAVGAASGSPLYLRAVTAVSGRAGSLPLGVREAVTARLDALPAPLRALTGAAAITGPIIDPALLAAALEVPESEVSPGCEELDREGILVREVGGWRFHHRLIATGAEALLTQRERKRLHLAVAGALSRRPEPDEAEVARHLDSAGDAAGAVRSYRRAAEQALRRLAIAEAAHYGDRAGELLEQCEPASAAESWLDIGQVRFACGRLEAAVDAFDAAEGSLTDTDHSSELLCRIRAGRARSVFWTFDMEAAARDAEAAVSMAETKPSGITDAARAEAYAALALIRSGQGRSSSAIDIAARAQDCAARAGQPALAAMSGALTILVNHHGGRSREAAALLPAVVDLCRREGQPGPLLWALFKGGLARAALGDFIGATEAFDELVDLAHRVESANYLCEVKNSQGHLAREQGRWAEADDLDTACMEEAGPLGAEEGGANAILNLVASALVTGDMDRAERMLERAEPLLDAGAFYRWRYRQRYRYYRARLLMEAGRVDQARELVEESLRLGVDAGEGKNILRPRLQLATIIARGDPERSRASLAEVAAEAEVAGLLPIAWRAHALAGDTGSAVRVLSLIEARIPDEHRPVWRREIASKVEEGDGRLGTLPL